MVVYILLFFYDFGNDVVHIFIKKPAFQAEFLKNGGGTATFKEKVARALDGF